MNNKQKFIEDELLVISKQTMDLLLVQDSPDRLIALYNFYLYTCKWQKTNQIKAATKYVAKGLKWEDDTVRKYKKILIALGLVEDVIQKNDTSKKVEGWYIKVNFILNLENHTPVNPPSGLTHTVDLPPINALRANNLNALKTVSKETEVNTSSFNNIGSKLKEKYKDILEKKVTPKEKARINSPHQFYGVEISDLLKLSGTQRGRVMGFIKQGADGYRLKIKATELLTSEEFIRMGQSEKVSYLIGAYRRAA